MRNRKYNTRKSFDKDALFNFIDSFEIEKSGDILITKFAGRVVKTVSVSNRYEIFDFRKYLKEHSIFGGRRCISQDKHN